jgi:hypothetical protein
LTPLELQPPMLKIAAIAVATNRAADIRASSIETPQRLG